LSIFSNVFDIIGEGGSSNSDFLSAVALPADGKVVLAGTHSHAFTNAVNALVRLNSNGGFDTSFGTNGVVTNKLPSNTEGLNLVLIQPMARFSPSEPQTTLPSCWWNAIWRNSAWQRRTWTVTSAVLGGGGRRLGYMQTSTTGGSPNKANRRRENVTNCRQTFYKTWTRE
jgi:hypothetical protein